MPDHSATSIITMLGLIVSYLIVFWPLFCCWWSVPSTGGSQQPLVRPSFDAPMDPSVCPACEAEGCAEEQGAPWGEPPPRIEQRLGRKRSVDTSSHYCPNQECVYHGWLGLGNIRANGHPNGGQWRQLECIVCHKTFLETINTIFYRKQVSAERIWQVLTCLAEGVGIRKTARIFDLDPNTVHDWLKQAAEHAEAVSHYLLHNLHLTQVQVDELWALMGKRDGEERHNLWIWAGVDAVSKLWLATVIGDRSQEHAQLLIHAIVVMLAVGCVPLFTSDQWSAYAAALLTHFGQWVAVPRRSPRGRAPKPRWQALPDLLYAQVVKQRIKGRVVSVTRRVVFGSLEAVQAALERTNVSQVVNTAFIERLNLAIRHHVAALGRKVSDLAKSSDGLQDQLSLTRAYYNFCLPHSSLRLALPHPLPTRGNGSPKIWQPRTPALTAGVTNHIWSMQELLLLRIPPWRQDAVSRS